MSGTIEFTKRKKSFSEIHTKAKTLFKKTKQLLGELGFRWQSLRK